ncbi:MAG: alpha/beta fold hydrolase [Solirubrobacteraceae bacterium]
MTPDAPAQLHNSAPHPPSPAKVGHVESSAGVNIYYEIAGGGPPVVFVAGLADDHASWATQVDALSGEHMVVTFDNRGIGGSSVPGGPYSIEEMAEDAHRLVHQLSLAPVCAVGSSMGGAICQRWALSHPGDIERLVLTNTWGERDHFLDSLFNHWIRLGEADLGQRALESVLLFCHDPDYLAAHPSAMDEALALGPPPMVGFVGAAHACREHDLLGELHRVTQPTLVIAGEGDLLTRPLFSRRLARALPDARLASLPTGHMVFWEEPAAFSDLLCDFLGNRT